MAATGTQDLDFWIPSYTGALSQPFRIRSLSALVVQVKSRERITSATPTPPVLVAGDLFVEGEEPGSKIPRSDIEQPVIFLWLEMGRGTPSSSGGAICRRHPALEHKEVEWWEVRSTALTQDAHPVLKRCNL